MERKDFEMQPNSIIDLQFAVDELLPPKWNVMSSILYALSILVKCNILHNIFRLQLATDPPPQ